MDFPERMRVGESYASEMLRIKAEIAKLHEENEALLLALQNRGRLLEKAETRIQELGSRLNEADDDKWDALRQGAIVAKDDAGEYIDNMCMSLYEDLCAYFEKQGRLTTENGRIYRIVK